MSAQQQYIDKARKLVVSERGNYVHAVIDGLIARARKLAPRQAEWAMDCGGSSYLMSEFAPKGQRQQLACALVDEAHRLNAIAEDVAAVTAEGLSV